MSTWYEYIQTHGTMPEWPYPLDYKKVNELECDVLVLGGGIAGCHAAINAKKKGANVIVVEKGPLKYSGDGGAGVDHWLAACTNPNSTITPSEFAESVVKDGQGFDCGITKYINAKESWDALLDMEAMGMQIRDDDDKFVGALFRDDETKLMYAYDYESKIDLRVYGGPVKQLLYKEIKRLGITICDRIMVTGLLTKGGKVGAPVIGATGLNTRTGEFYVFRCKAAVCTVGHAERIWSLSTEYHSLWNDMNASCDGLDICWRAGAEFVNLEQSTYFLNNPLAYISYGVGNYSNTWYPCNIVDADGKEIPWVDRDGNPVHTYEDRLKRNPGQNFVLGSGYGAPIIYSNQGMTLIKDLAQRIRKGEYKLPLYADLTSIPEHDRNAIWGLMVGNEGKTKVPVYDTITDAGFESSKDLMRIPIKSPEFYFFNPGNYWSGEPNNSYRSLTGGGLLVDWNLKTSLDGLYAAGFSAYGSGAHSTAACNGRYAGRHAALYAASVSLEPVDEVQVAREFERVYAPLANKDTKYGWKELNIATCRAMQEYCGVVKTEEGLKEGLQLIREIRANLLPKTYANNPHELLRVTECASILTGCEMIIHASLRRKCSNPIMEFNRVEYPQHKVPDNEKLFPIRFNGTEVESRELDKDFYLKAPYSSSYDENYDKYCAL